MTIQLPEASSQFFNDSGRDFSRFPMIQRRIRFEEVWSGQSGAGTTPGSALSEAVRSVLRIANRTQNSSGIGIKTNAIQRNGGIDEANTLDQILERVEVYSALTHR